MAYGDGHAPEELEYTELLFRVEDLVGEWYGAFFGYVHAPSGDDATQKLGVDWAERRLEEVAMDLALELKTRRLRREGGLELLPEERKGGAA